jgi:Fungal protein kinase
LAYYKISLTDIGLRNLALDLVTALQGLPASRVLPSSTGRGHIYGDLLNLNAAIYADGFDFEQIVPLLNAVLNNETDEVIWNNVYAAVARPTTPLQSNLPFTASFQQTPWTFSTGMFEDTSDLRRHVDPILKAEVDGNLIIDHPQFFDTFFGQAPQRLEISIAVFQMCKDSEPSLYTEGAGWAEWPEGCEEPRVLDWLSRHVEKFLLFASERGFRPRKHRRCVTTPNKPIPGSVSKRKMDVGFAYELSGDGDGLTSTWSDILVTGELKSNSREDNHQTTWLDLIRYAREVFSGQDTRRFVLGFTLCGSLMRLWVFDRLGGVASQPFDINKDGQMFVSAILGYLWMDEEELGFDPTILEEDSRRYTSIVRNGLVERIYLEEVILRKCSVVGRATTCWRSSPVGPVKDSWQYEERPEEGLLLREATEAGVENVARYYHHETVYVGGAVDDVRNNIRKGLQDAHGRNPFQQRRPIQSESITSQATSGILDRVRGRTNTRSITRKRSSSSIHTSIPPPKRPCSESPVKQDAQRQRNRVHRRVIMCDIGKSIHHASSLGALLIGLLGGIKGKCSKDGFRLR